MIKCSKTWLNCISHLCTGKDQVTCQSHFNFWVVMANTSPIGARAMCQVQFQLTICLWTISSSCEPLEGGLPTPCLHTVTRATSKNPKELTSNLFFNFLSGVQPILKEKQRMSLNHSRVKSSLMTSTNMLDSKRYPQSLIVFVTAAISSRNLGVWISFPHKNLNISFSWDQEIGLTILRERAPYQMFS